MRLCLEARTGVLKMLLLILVISLWNFRTLAMPFLHLRSLGLFPQRNEKEFIGIGAVIRDSSGRVVAAISKPMQGKFSVELGELLAFREGLLLAKRNNLAIFSAEVDVVLVVSQINSDSIVLGDAMFLIYDIKELCVKVGGCYCQAIPRLANSLAHGLVKLAISLGEEFVWWNVNPSCIFPGC
ncbi:hypothetical protein LWI29_002494 [Acer saccharum]|uniref:RNase H type-1 domain-containing protein n=1 Tax=Acer saccharum TaxID=4024 RepID=A0AA39W5N4_ACESA|nr:hypothetical protein LWI29_002494 [Acer saccharum]